MKCLECRELLQRRLDGEAIPVQTLEPHLSECSACREQHVAAQQMLDALQQQAPPTLPADFAHRMTAQVVEDRQERHDKLRRRVWLTLALAASVLIVMVLAYYWMPRSENQPTPPIITDNSKKGAPAPRRVDDPKDAPKRAEAPSALAALTDRWVDTTRDHAKVFSAAASLNGVDRLPMPELPMNPSARDAGQEVSEGVRSVTRNARKALDFFARELPMPELGEDKN
ncbi:MAG: hypothetical protein HYR84_01770 [Planctomycetes bacterium]|nr:hypothetical protein [Planctomycetota bacterium]